VGAEVAVFDTESCKCSMEKIMGAQNFNYASKFMGDFGPKILRQAKI